MSKSKTKTIETQYGTAEIEVVECDSCGQTIGKDDAVEFTIGSRDGYACQHCEQNGPISWPKKVVDWSMPQDTDNGENVGLLFFCSMYVLAMPIYTVGGFTDDDEFSQGFAAAIVSTAVWLTIVGVIILA